MLIASPRPVGGFFVILPVRVGKQSKCSVMSRTVKGRNGGTLIPWKKGESGNPNGRPRKMLTKLQKAVGVDFNASLSRSDHYAIIQAVLEFTRSEIEKLATDKDAPVFLSVLCEAIKRDLAAGRTTTVNELYDRLFGRPRQVQEISGPAGGPISYENVKDRLNAFYVGDDDTED